MAAHIEIQESKRVRITNKGMYREWECFLKGVFVGRIDWLENREPWQKPYEAAVKDDPDEEEWRLHHIGWFDTLFAAKVALEKPAETYVKMLGQETVPVAYLPAADMEFYPTPPKIAGELFAGVEWRYISSVLEPSAGKGDLIGYAKGIKLGKDWQGYPRRFGDNRTDIDCIELDENLRQILKGKGYRVVGDDFLSFNTRKRYDLILMNPPFSNGDLHLLHALELCENGGQIACILNAETIRNPYTNRRKTLIKKLMECNASIRFVEDAFKKAKRKADVDVALINVNIPFAKADTSIIDGLKKAEEEKNGDVVIESDLAPSNPIDRLIREYDLLCAAGIKLMDVYNGVRKYIRCTKEKDGSPIIGLEIAGHKAHHEICNAEINDFLSAARIATGMSCLTFRN